MTGMGDAGAGDGVTVEVLRGNPTEEELAALVAVVGAAYQDEVSAAVVEDEIVRSAWDVSARALRRPLRRELGWRAG